MKKKVKMLAFSLLLTAGCLSVNVASNVQASTLTSTKTSIGTISKTPIIVPDSEEGTGW